MKVDKVEPDAVTYSAIVDSCLRGGRVSDALALYDEMQAKHVEPWESLGGNLALACFNEGNIGKAARVFASLTPAAQYRLDERARFALFNSTPTPVEDGVRQS